MGEIQRHDDERDPDEPEGLWPVESEAGAAAGELQSRLEALRDRCACLSRDYEDLTAELTAFRVRYHSALGPLYIQLEGVRLQICRLRTAMDIARKTPRLPTDELRAWVNTRTREETARLHGLEDEVEWDGKVEAASERAREVPADEQRLLRRLYRKLAIRFHPDLQLDAATKRRCERLMVRIGELYRARDLEGLELLAEEAGGVIETVFLEPPAFHEWLVSRVARLEQRVAELERQVELLWQSDLAVLMRRHRDAEQAGRDLFAEMAAAAQNDLAACEEELRRLRAQTEALPPGQRERVADWLRDEP